MLKATLDLRVGGMFKYCMSHPNGMAMWGRCVFRIISRPDKLEYISSFSNVRGEVTPAPFQGLDDFPAEVLTTVTFVDHAGIGKGTLVTTEARPLMNRAEYCVYRRARARILWSGSSWPGSCCSMRSHG